jgi:hypothetical protein
MGSVSPIVVVGCMWFCGGLRVLRWLEKTALLLEQVARLILSVRK